MTANKGANQVTVIGALFSTVREQSGSAVDLTPIAHWTCRFWSSCDELPEWVLESKFSGCWRA